MRRIRQTTVRSLVFAWLSVLALACQSEQPAKIQHAAPATVDHPGVEAKLTTLTLTPDAERRLGVEVASVERRNLARTRSYSGELLVAPGRAITVSSPVPGTLMAPAGGGVPLPGTGVEAGEEVFRLLPMSPPQQDLERLETESRARLDEVRARTSRTRRLYDEGVVALSFLEQDAAALAIAEADLQSVLAQKELLAPSTLGGGGGVSVLSVKAPLAARLGALYAAPGQAIASAAPLFDLVSDASLWVRVPVYVGDLESIDPEQDAMIHALRGLRADARGFEPRSATPVPGPPSANADAATVDLFFELAPPRGSLQPGQKVGVTLAQEPRIGGDGLFLAVPHAAIVYDIHGGTWVYERRVAQQYVRRRVEVSHVGDGVAYLTRGPAEGTAVVSVGAAELFGTEFGVDK
jgi:cobalt-zinc-cadmium efflux system membrane fusion protein